MKLSERPCMWYLRHNVILLQHVAVSTKNRKHQMFKSHNPYYLLSDDTGGYILRDWFL